MGIVISLCSGPVLITELSHPRQRGTVASLFGAFFSFGAILSAWTAYGTLTRLKGSWTWRLPTLLQIAPATIQLCLMLLLPESPRWLINKDRADEAKAVLAKYHGNGDMEDELINMEFTEVCESIEREKYSNNLGWKSIFLGWPNRRRFFVNFCVAFFAQWSGSGVISYYFVPVLKSVGISSYTQQSAINGGLQIFNFFMTIFSATLVDRFGRRRLFLTSVCGMLVTMTIVTIASARFAETGNHGAGYAVIVFLFFFNAAFDLAWGILPTMYTAEIYPYTIRSKAVSLNFMMTFTAGLFNQYVNPIALDESKFALFFQC